jgi:hypothetical protein
MKKIYAMSLLAGMMASGAQAQESPVWWTRYGVFYRGGGSFELSGASIVQDRGLQAAETGVRSPLSDVGTTSAEDDRVYDDGYVNADPGTSGTFTGRTSDWGYESSSQLSGSTLTFTRTGPDGLIQTGSSSASLAGDETAHLMGLEFIMGRVLRKGERHQWDATAALRFSYGPEASVTAVPYTESYQGRVIQIVDRYSVGAIPSAPYSGAPASGSIDFDSTIPNIPSSRSTRVLTAGEWQAENRVQADVETMLLELRFGPQFQFYLNDRWTGFVLPSISANLVSMDITHTETLTALFADGSQNVVQRFSSSESETDVLFGAGLQVGAELALSARTGLGFSLGYDFIEETDVRLGPTVLTADLSGFTAAVRLDYAFGGGE